MADGGIEVKTTRGTLKITEYKCSQDWCTKSGSTGFFAEGYASTNDLDLGNDVITSEALRAVVKEVTKDPYNKVFLNHETREIPIGKIVAAKLVDGSKLWVRIKLNEAHPLFAVAWQSLQEGYLSAFSIQFIILERKEPEKQGDPRLITKIRILEVSFVGIPANPGALVTGVEEVEGKALIKSKDSESKQKVISMEQETEIRELKAKVEKLQKEGEAKDENIKRLQGELKEFEDNEAKTLAEKIAELDPDAGVEGKKLDELKGVYVRALEKTVKAGGPHERAPSRSNAKEIKEEPDRLLKFSDLQGGGK